MLKALEIVETYYCGVKNGMYLCRQTSYNTKKSNY